MFCWQFLYKLYYIEELYYIEVLMRQSKFLVQAFSYHECIKVNPLDGCTFSPHGIIKGRHLVKSLNIRMAQISMKIVIFPRLVRYNYNQTINLFLYHHEIQNHIHCCRTSTRTYNDLSTYKYVFLIENNHFSFKYSNFSF